MSSCFYVFNAGVWQGNSLLKRQGESVLSLFPPHFHKTPRDQEGKLRAGGSRGSRDLRGREASTVYLDRNFKTLTEIEIERKNLEVFGERARTTIL